MKSFVEFNQILVEGRYGSEHGHRTIWNEFRFNKSVKTALGQAVDILNNKNASDEDKEEAERLMKSAADQMRSRIEKAKDDLKDPLNFNNAQSKNFKKGKTDGDAESYYNELENNIDAVAYAAREKKMRAAVKDGWKMVTAGKEKGTLSKIAQRGGAEPYQQTKKQAGETQAQYKKRLDREEKATYRGVTSKTSKSDNVLIDPTPSKPKTGEKKDPSNQDPLINPLKRTDKESDIDHDYKKIGVSHKQGASTQVAGGEPGEVRGVGAVVAKQASMKKPKGPERDAERERVLSKFKDVADTTDYRGDDPDEIKRRKAAGQQKWNKMRDEDPATLQRYTQAQASRRGVFDKTKGGDMRDASASITTTVPATGKPEQGSSNKQISKMGGITPGVTMSKGGKGSNRPLANRQLAGKEQPWQRLTKGGLVQPTQTFAKQERLVNIEMIKKQREEAQKKAEKEREKAQKEREKAQSQQSDRDKKIMKLSGGGAVKKKTVKVHTYSSFDD